MKMLFCDIDGTLVRPGNRVLDGDVEMLREAVGRGVHLFLVTGRPSRCLSDLPPAVKELSCDFVTSNGASRVVDGRTKIIAALDGELVSAFSTALRESAPTVNFATEHESAFGYEPGYAWWPATDTGADAMCAEISALAGSVVPITKLLCRSRQLNAGELAGKAGALGFDVTVTYSSRPQEGGPVEVLAPVASKGHAVQRILRDADLSPAAAVAFGDRANDISMLDSVGKGVVINPSAEPGLSAFESAPSVGEWLANHREHWSGHVDNV